jgi:hypothetical protein
LHCPTGFGEQGLPIGARGEHHFVFELGPQRGHNERSLSAVTRILPGRKRKTRIGRLIQVATWGVAAVAIIQELRKPAAQREWNGTVGGVIPYDFRLPTADRLRQRLWNPNGPVVSPQVFGVGWSLNAGKLVALARDRMG